MASVKLPRRAHKLQFIREHRNTQSYSTDGKDVNNIINNEYHYSQKYSTINKPTRTLSCDEPEGQSSSSSTNNNRLRQICSRVKRRFSFTKEHRTHSEGTSESVSERRMTRFGNYKSFSSSVEDSSNEFEWPDFEKVYDAIPSCLINALPGIDDRSAEDDNDYALNISNFHMDETEEYAIEQTNLFLQCKRGKCFRRNAICSKLDKTQYHGQLGTFVQQLMIEKLMRTWS